MEVRRRLQKNKLINDIRDAETFISRSEETIKRIKNSKMGAEYVQNQIEKLKNSIVEQNEILSSKEQELSNVRAGLLDEQINDEYTQNSIKHDREKQERCAIKEFKKEEKKEKKDISQKYWKGIITASRSERQKERDYRYGLKYFRRVCDQLPDYMKRNLSDMPNNKGYIWRGIHFYGYRRQQAGPVVMFEKQKGNILVIHENTEKEYRRYEKKGTGRKQLIHREMRKKGATDSSLMDYLK